MPLQKKYIYLKRDRSADVIWGGNGETGVDKKGRKRERKRKEKSSNRNDSWKMGSKRIKCMQT
jgi:hypothetical protein